MSTPTPTRIKTLTPPVRRTQLRLVVPQAASDVPTTPYLNLNLPPTGFPSWGPDLNQNFSAIDAAVGALQRSYQGEWVNNRVYAAGQIVIYESGVFISLISGNINLQPDTHPDSWGPMGSATSITYPPAGIAVSTGSTGWGTSINPATVAYLNTANVFTLPQTFASDGATIHMRGNIPAVSVDVTHPGSTISWNLTQGNGETSFINIGALVGSGGFGWYNTWVNGPALSAATPVMRVDSGGAFTVAKSLALAPTGSPSVSIQSQVNAGRYGALFGAVSTAPNVLAGYQFDGFTSDFSNSTTWMNMWQIAGQSPQIAMNGITSINGSLSITGTLVTTNQITAPTVVGIGVASPLPIDGNGKVSIGQGGEGSPCIFLTRSAGGTAQQHIWSIVSWDGTLRFSAMSDDNATTNFVWMNVIRSGATVTGIALTAATVSMSSNVSVAQNMSANIVYGNLISVPSATNNLELATDGGSTFLDGGSGGRLLINNRRTGGYVGVLGTFSVTGTKTFIVTHPFDETKELIHACLEGPENGVYYRGEVTTENGEAEVTLPDYFEAMTFPEERSVLLTQMFEDDDIEFAQMAASRITEGKFRVRSSVARVTVSWEVKGVRQLGVDKLELVREKIPIGPLRNFMTPETVEEEKPK